VVEEKRGEVVLTSLRDLALDDIPSAMELSTAAGWNQTPEDWSRIIRLSPRGCRCIEAAEEVAATTTLLAYGMDLGWVGMVLTRPEYRRKELARRLMEDAISNAEAAGIRTLKLDATAEGRPLYESFGFVVEEIVERWGRDEIASRGDEKTLKQDLSSREECQWSTSVPEQLFALDVEAFGVSREQVLKELCASGGNTSVNGYVLSRSGRTARSVGPCVATSEDEARWLIAAHLNALKDAPQNSQNSWYWDLLPSNVAAVRCATEFGFTRRRTLWRMRRGEPIENNDAMVFATAGFELG
jgi:GNAT superfamily N-acetyltransferase